MAGPAQDRTRWAPQARFRGRATQGKGDRESASWGLPGVLAPWPAGCPRPI
jgi:hypothetical protein